MFLVDTEGALKTTDVRPPRRRPPRRRPPRANPPGEPQVTATFINGKPRTVKGVVVMKGEYEWDRFMRFMERCARARTRVAPACAHHRRAPAQPARHYAAPNYYADIVLVAARLGRYAESNGMGFSKA